MEFTTFTAIAAELNSLRLRVDKLEGKPEPVVLASAAPTPAGTVHVDADGKPVGVSDGAKIIPIDHSIEPVPVAPVLDYPRIVYLHPEDKTKDATYISVANEEEEKAAAEKGYQRGHFVPDAPGPTVTARPPVVLEPNSSVVVETGAA